MTKQRYFRLALCAGVIAVLGFNALAQGANTLPELSVAGIKLGDRESAKAFLNGYSLRKGADGRFAYFFYNSLGTQVMKLTAQSAEEPYFITEIEVFSVGRSYLEQHYVAKDLGAFTTESGIFIGQKASVSSVMFGVPNRIGPKDVVKKKGEPTNREKTGKDESIIYALANMKLPAGEFDYTARYEFSKNKLKKFSLKISSDTAIEKKLM
jgi:hypothetical protein